VRLGQALGGPPGGLDRLRPGPAQPQDLRPVDQALAGEGDQVGLAVAPGGQGLGPLTGPAQLRHLLADVDHPAVDQARHRGRELAGDGGHHGLVQHGQPLVDVAAGDRGRSLDEQGQRDQVGLAGLAADPGRPGRGRPGGGVVSGPEQLQGRRDQQVALLGAVRRLLLQQPPGPGQPAAALGQLPPAEQQEAQPEGAAGGPPPVALAGVELLGALQGGHGVTDPAGEVGRCPQLLQLVAVQASHHTRMGVSSTS
jgi:hypothetical protein